MKEMNFIKLTLVTIAVLAGVFLISCSSDTNTLHTINGIQVPPDPGAAGKATLAGIDSNNSGVRDDVERFIAERHGSNKKEYDAAFIHAKIIQNIFVNDNKTPESKVAAFDRNSECATDDELDFFSDIEGEYMNTNKRGKKFINMPGILVGKITEKEGDCG